MDRINQVQRNRKNNAARFAEIKAQPRQQQKGKQGDRSLREDLGKNKGQLAGLATWAYGGPAAKVAQQAFAKRKKLGDFWNYLTG
jgi:hypothetical protein